MSIAIALTNISIYSSDYVKKTTTLRPSVLRNRRYPIFVSTYSDMQQRLTYGRGACHFFWDSYLEQLETHSETDLDKYGKCNGSGIQQITTPHEDVLPTTLG